MHVHIPRAHGTVARIQSSCARSTNVEKIQKVASSQKLKVQIAKLFNSETENKHTTEDSGKILARERPACCY